MCVYVIQTEKFNEGLTALIIYLKYCLAYSVFIPFNITNCGFTVHTFPLFFSVKIMYFLKFR